MPIRIYAKEKGPWYRGYRRQLLLEIEAGGLDGANLTAAELAGADLAQCSLAKTILANADLRHADLTGARMTSATLDSANLEHAELAGAVLVTASMNRVNCQWANLWGANLSGARCNDARFDKANLMTARLAAGSFRRASFRETELSKVLARGAAFTGASFRGAVLKESDFSHALLSEADFTEAKLIAADLSRADAESANFTQTQLRGANLTETLLDRATLLHAGFSRAIMRLCNLQQANADEANFEDADLYGANLAACSARESRFARCTLARSNLSRGNFSAATFEAANLSECFAEDAHFEAANLSRCNLKSANLQRASLVRANLWGADLEGCDLRGAKLTEATLQSSQLASVIYDVHTEWPRGITPGESRAPIQAGGHAERRTFRAHHAPIEAVAFTPDGKLAITGDRLGELILWDVESASSVQQSVVGTAIRALIFKDERHALISARQRPDNRGELRLLDIVSWTESYRETFPSELRTIANIPGKEATLIAGEFGLSVWTPHGGEQPLRGDVQELDSCSVTADGRFAIALSGGAVLLFNLSRGRMTEQLDVGDATSLATAGGSDVWVGTGRKKLCRIDAEQEKVIEQLAVESPPRILAYDPAKNLLIYAGADHRVRLIALPGGQEIAQDDHNSQPIYCLGFVPQTGNGGRDEIEVYSAGYDHLLRVWTMKI